MIENLKPIVQIIKQLEGTSSTKDKEVIIRKNSDNELLKKVLLYTYDGEKKFKVSKKSIKPRDGISKWDSLFDMLDELSISNINDNLRINVNRFLGQIEDDDERDLVQKILLKDLKCKISTKTINKAVPNLIYEFNVMKASAWNDKTKDSFISKAKKVGYTMSIKDNGERGIVIKENGKITIKSRQNKLFEQLVDLEKAFEFMPDNMVYEGELLAFNPEGGEWKTSEEQFKLTNKILHTIGEKHGIYIALFDIIDLDDFIKGVSKVRAKDRKERIRQLVEEYSSQHDDNLIQSTKVLYQGKDTDLIQTYLEEYSKDSYKEGLMVILHDNVYYADKRVKTHLKVKLWNTMDLKVVGLKESVEKPNTLGSLVLDYKGEEQGCAGISDALKELWWNNPSEIVGKVVEVKYKAITVDKEGNESLQFCTFVRVREQGKEVSYD